MIEIEALLRDGGMEVLATGHAGFAPVGQDIICAGVSALLFGFVAYVETLSPVGGGKAPHVEYRAGDGMLYLRTRGLAGADAVGWTAVAAGLRLIAEAYPGHVRFKDRGTVPHTS